MRIHRQEAINQGFIIDDCCYPPFAYKGLRFIPDKFEDTFTELEEELLGMCKAFVDITERYDGGERVDDGPLMVNAQTIIAELETPE